MPPLVKVMAWCREDNAPLPESLMTQLIAAYMRHQTLDL